MLTLGYNETEKHTRVPLVHKAQYNGHTAFRV